MLHMSRDHALDARPDLGNARLLPSCYFRAWTTTTTTTTTRLRALCTMPPPILNDSEDDEDVVVYDDSNISSSHASGEAAPAITLDDTRDTHNQSTGSTGEIQARENTYISTFTDENLRASEETDQRRTVEPLSRFQRTT